MLHPAKLSARFQPSAVGWRMVDLVPAYGIHLEPAQGRFCTEAGPWYMRCWAQMAVSAALQLGVPCGRGGLAAAAGIMRMTPEFAVELLKATMMQAVMLAAPILLVSMVIGLAVSLFQAVTTIHEASLTFAPKALGIIVLLIVLLPWLLRSLVEFSTLVIQKLPQMVR